ncbi:MAG: hypothetical protein J5883_00620, partial [Clostridiales bacterium]|nr:hypothetical protein [Clostridiales bacterium]
DDSDVADVSKTDLADARTVNVDIEHYLGSVPRVTINVYNLDYATDQPLQGGVFEVYKKSPTGAEELFFINTNERADLLRQFTLDSDNPEELIFFEGTYFIRQITAPTDYNDLTGILKITIDSNMNVFIEESPRNVELITVDSTLDPIRVVFYNTRPPVAPTGYISYTVPMFLLLGAGVLMLILSGSHLEKKDRNRKIRKVKNIRRLKEVAASG